MVTCFFNNYDSTKKYTHSQIQKIIESMKNVLCFYAKETGLERCALALDFDQYSGKDGSIPLYILSDKEIWALSLTQGEKLLETYNNSQIGKDLIVIYTAQECKGWHRMTFDLGKYAQAI